MPARSRRFRRLEAQPLKGRNEPHEAIAGRAPRRPDRPRARCRRASWRRRLRASISLLAEAILTKLAASHTCRQATRSSRPSQPPARRCPAVGLARGDRDPGNGLALEIADKPNSGSGIDTRLHHRLALRGRAPCARRPRRLPSHTPAIFRPARRAEQCFEIGPVAPWSPA